MKYITIYLKWLADIFIPTIADLKMFFVVCLWIGWLFSCWYVFTTPLGFIGTSIAIVALVSFLTGLLSIE